MTRADDVRNSLNKFLKSDVIKKGSDPAFVVEYLTTGLLPVDILLQGGLPRGRFTMMQGDWSTMKTYIGLCAIRETQAAGGVCSLIDTEHAFDPNWARSIGVDVDALLLVQADTGELALDTAEAMTYDGVDLIVFDSMAAALPQAEKEKRLYKENNQPGRQAALFSLACRKLTTANARTAYFWINQMRENIGMSFGPREKATGGRAMPYYSSYIIETKKVGKVTEDTEIWTGEKFQSSKMQVGQKFKMELVKSKLNKPFREIWFDWSMTDSAIDLTGFIIAQGIETGLIVKRANTWLYPGQNISVAGREKFKARIHDDADLVAALDRDVRLHHGLPVPKAPLADTKRSTGRSRKSAAPAKKAATRKTMRRR